MADRYWVGGTGTWDATSTANWSASSGGGTGASVPTAADNVFFDVNSNVGTGAFTVTMANDPRVCNDFTASGLDGVMTLDGTSIGLTISGSLLFPATNLTITYSGTTTFNATTAGKTITANGKTFTSAVTFNGIGGVWTFGSAFNCSNFVTHTNGTIDTSSVGNYAFTWGQLSSANSNVRTLNLNASTCNTGSFTPGIQCTPTNWAFNAGTSTINFNGTSTGIDASGGGLTFYNVAWPLANSGAPITGANTFNNFTVASKTSLDFISTFTFESNQTINGTLTVTASLGAPYRTGFASSVIGTTRTLTCASIAAMTDVDFRDITIAGAHGTLSGTRLGNCGGNTNITFPSAKTVYYGQTGSANWGASGSGSWSATSGGALDATQFPLPQDTAVFPAATYPASGSTTTINADYNIGTIDMSLRTSNTMTLATSTNYPTIYGNWTNGTGITNTGTGIMTFSGRTTQQITSAGISFGRPITIDAPSSTVQLQDAFTVGATITTTLTRGTLDLQSFTLSTGLFSSSGSSTRTIAFGTGNITCTGVGTAWSTSTASSLTTTGTKVVNVTSTGSTAITVLPGIMSESNSISFNFTGGTYALTFLGTSQHAAKNVNFTGYAGTWQQIGLTSPVIYGNLTLSTGMSLTASTRTLYFSAFTGTQQITSNGKVMDFNVGLGVFVATIQLLDNMTVGATKTAYLIFSTLDLQSFTLSTGSFNSNYTNTRTIAFGTGNITCTGTGTVWDTTTVTGLTTTGTQVVNVTSAGSTAITASTGALSEANSISYNFTGGTYALTFLGTASYSARNVNFTGYAGTWGATSTGVIYGNLTLASGMTLTASASAMSFSATSGTQTITSNAKTMDFPITINGNSATTVTCADALTLGSTRALTFSLGTLKLAAGATSTVGSFVTSGTTLKYLKSTTPGTQATISDASGTNTVTYLSIQDSAATGGATWDATSATNVNALNNTGWTFGSTGKGRFFQFF